MNDSVIASLAEKAKQGDMQAFEQLYTEFSPLVYSILFEMSHDKYEAENLTQDCFVSALQSIHTLKEPEKTKKWLTAIAANHGRDYLKKKKPALLGSEHEYIFDIKEEDDTSLIPEASTELDERSEEIREIVNSVSEDKRLCLVLFYQHEMSIAEISEELGISQAAVKSRLFRAREDIKEEVEKRNKKGMPLFSVAPLPLILFALRKSSEAATASFAGSTAQATAFAAVTATANTAAVTAASTATATAGTATATVSGAAVTTTATATATGTAAAATGISVKVIAIAAAGAIAVGGGAVGAKVVHDRRAAATTTAIIEESTELSSENIAVAATESESGTEITFENTTLTVSTANGTTVLTVGSAASDKATTAVNTTQAVKTSQQTTAKTEPTTAAKPTTTAEQPTTVKPTTTDNQSDAAAETVPSTAAPTTTTTKPVTTEKPTTTQAPTTASASPATVTVTVWSSTGSTSKTLSFEPGETITADIIENRLSDEHGIEAIVDAINVTAESGGSYTATAYE